MKKLFLSEDGTVFNDEQECLAHEADLARRASVPVILIEEAIRQATPYMVTAKERRELAATLRIYLPIEQPAEPTISPPPNH